LGKGIGLIKIAGLSQAFLFPSGGKVSAKAGKKKGSSRSRRKGSDAPLDPKRRSSRRDLLPQKGTSCERKRGLGTRASFYHLEEGAFKSTTKKKPSRCYDVSREKKKRGATAIGIPNPGRSKPKKKEVHKKRKFCSEEFRPVGFDLLLMKEGPAIPCLEGGVLISSTRSSGARARKAIV